MTTASYASKWKDSCDTNRRAEADELIKKARRTLNLSSPDEIAWLRSALKSSDLRNFVAAIFQRHSVPRILLNDMIEAAVRVDEASMCRYFIEPCLASYDVAEVQQVLLPYIHSADSNERRGADKCKYWLAAKPIKRV